MRSFYEILDVSRKASHEEIVAAYRRRVKESHPDHGGDAIEFQNVRKGYEILSNEEKRIKYDKWLDEKESKEKGVESELHNQNCQNVDKLREELLGCFSGLLARYSFDKKLCDELLYTFKNKDSVFRNIEYASNETKRTKSIKVLYASASLLAQSFPRYTIYKYIQKDCMDLLNGINSSPEEIRKKANTGASSNSGVKMIVRFVGVIFVLFLINECYESCLSHNKARKIDENEKIRESIVQGIREDTKENLSYNTSIPKFDTSSDIPVYIETKYKNGAMPYKSYYGNGRYDSKSLSELTIKNNTSLDAVVFLCSEDDVVRHVYVNTGTCYTMKKIPQGTYIIKIAHGKSWYDDKDNGNGNPSGGFMKSESYSKSEWNDPLRYTFERTDQGVNYPTYTITLEKVLNGNFNTERTSQDDFFLN